MFKLLLRTVLLWPFCSYGFSVKLLLRVQEKPNGIFCTRRTLFPEKLILEYQNSHHPSNVAKSVDNVPNVMDFNSVSRVSRRQFVAAAVAIVTFLEPWHETLVHAQEQESLGQGSRKPFAPVEALLPATRVKLWIDRTLELAMTLQQLQQENERTISVTKQQQGDILLRELQKLLLQPQTFVDKAVQLTPLTTASSRGRPAKAYMDTYQRGLDRLSLLEKPGAWFVQSGEIAEWKFLEKQELAKESTNDLRAAFNAYTARLNFRADAYLLNVPKAERSRMIREDELPDVKSVIDADLDLRSLYRNSVLTAMEEARSELEFQLVQSTEKAKEEEKSSTMATASDDYSTTAMTVDWTELVQLLSQAKSACDAWFSFIDERDVEEAMARVVQAATTAEA